jgi:hypothetical protein
MRLIVALVLAAGSAGCSVAGTDYVSAVRETSEVSAMEDTVSDLDKAIQECATLAEFQAAVEQFPDALDGVEARTFVSNRCAAEPGIAESAICAELAELSE